MEQCNVAVIGGGPAGIAAAVEAYIMGVRGVTLFERGDTHSMTIRTYYKENKRVDKDWRGQKVELHGHIAFVDGTKESTIDLFEELLREHDVEAKFNIEIDTVLRDGEAFVLRTTNAGDFRAKNVIIAIGNMGKPNKPNYKIPPEVKSKVGHNLEKIAPEDEVLVVGGGDSAVEYACALADTNKTTLTYRREEFSRVNPENLRVLEEKKAAGLALKLGTDITGLEAAGEKVKVLFVDSSVLEVDRIVYAIGGVAPTDFLKKCGVPVDGKGFGVYDPETHMTEVPGLYVAGDIAASIGGSIGAALNHGYAIAKHIKERMG